MIIINDEDENNDNDKDKNDDNIDEVCMPDQDIQSTSRYTPTKKRVTLNNKNIEVKA